MTALTSVRVKWSARGRKKQVLQRCDLHSLCSTVHPRGIPLLLNSPTRQEWSNFGSPFYFSGSLAERNIERRIFCDTWAWYEIQVQRPFMNICWHMITLILTAGLRLLPWPRGRRRVATETSLPSDWKYSLSIPSQESANFCSILVLSASSSFPWHVFIYTMHLFPLCGLI